MFYHRKDKEGPTVFDVVLFMASYHAGFMTGAGLVVDGGWTE